MDAQLTSILWHYRPPAFSSVAKAAAQAAQEERSRSACGSAPKAQPCACKGPAAPQPQGQAKAGGLQGLHGRPAGARDGRPMSRRPLPPLTPGVVRTFTVLGGNDSETDQKVALLIERIIKPALTRKLGWTRALLSEILAGSPRRVNGHAKALEAVRIFEWVRSRIRYVNDPHGQELFTELELMLKRGMGDCDDMAALLVTLFLAAGIPARLRVIKTKKSKGWAHIYPVAFVDGKWRAFDATEPRAAGWEYPTPTAQKDYEVKL
ncbi:MAG TPA: transglutaminase-like domain-containing protein [Holophagaceae bacterium]|nr:transglutaminase-like domain-containing protein [Holophagaceae bacterium]